MSLLPSARLFPAVVAISVLLSLSSSLRAALPALPGTASESAPAEVDNFTPESVAQQRVALQQEIVTARKELSKLSEMTSDESARSLTQETALLERIDAVYAEQQRTAQHAADLGTEGAEVEANTRDQRPAELTFKPPYDTPLLDQLYAERDYLEQARGWLKTDVGNAESALQEARDTLEEKERARRATRERENNQSGELRLTELETRLAQETVRLREKALKTLKLQRSLLEPKQKLLRPRFDWLRANLTFSPEELVTLQQAQEKRAATLDAAIIAAKTDAERVTQAAIATERRRASGDDAEELETHRANRQTANLTLSVLTAQRERLADEMEVAELRRSVLAAALSTKELRSLAQENRDAMDELARERKREATALIKSRKELQDWQSRLARSAAAEEKPVPWGIERVRRLSAWINLSEVELAELDHLSTERSRLTEEIGEQVNLFSWRDASAITREKIAAAWNYEVFSVQDAPVRVKTILAVLLLIVIGHKLSRWLSEFVSRTVFKRMGMNTGRRAAWQTLWFYALFIGVLVVAFNLFHISLTQFSVVSGALAVGIGFGSQNLISNFLSGIILLIERPVNQGDVIEIDGRQVTVERLGPRSTIVRTLQNTHMVVPNSRLLEQPVINWTLSDDIVRKQIRLGVAYDSPTRKVEELLREVLASLSAVRKEPAPTVRFMDFADSSLVFEIYFWVSIGDPVDAESELRHRIAEVFTKEAIVMAFPQRDVHLETTKPLEVIITQPASQPAVQSAPAT